MILIGERIREVREARKLSQQDVADMLEVTVAHVKKVEIGKREFSIKTISLFAELLDTSLDYLVFGRETPEYCVSEIRQYADCILKLTTKADIENQEDHQTF